MEILQKKNNDFHLFKKNHFAGFDFSLFLYLLKSGKVIKLIFS